LLACNYESEGGPLRLNVAFLDLVAKAEGGQGQYEFHVRRSRAIDLGRDCTNCGVDDCTGERCGGADARYPWCGDWSEQ
jgi:hypothetical protein